MIYKNGRFLDTAETYLDTLVNKRYKDYGFMPTTMVKNSVFQDRVIELKIKVPRLSKAVFVSIKDLAGFETQYELLFPRGKILILKDYQISNDRKTITIDAQMQPPCNYSQSCNEIDVDNLQQPQFDLKPGNINPYKTKTPYKRF